MVRCESCFGIWEAYSVDDDIFILDDKGELYSIPLFEAANQKSSKAFNMSLADFIAPKNLEKDYIGAFVVSSGTNDVIAKNFERDWTIIIL